MRYTGYTRSQHTRRTLTFRRGTCRRRQTTSSLRRPFQPQSRTFHLRVCLLRRAAMLAMCSLRLAHLRVELYWIMLLQLMLVLVVE